MRFPKDVVHRMDDEAESIAAIRLSEKSVPVLMIPFLETN